jgi:hypothetical protein
MTQPGKFCFPCMRFFPGMKHWIACVHLHRMYSIYRHALNHAQPAGASGVWLYTVKRVDEVVRHPHLMTQDQFTQVSKKVSDIPAENFTINIELFRQTFTNVEQKQQYLGANLDFRVYFPMLYHCATLSSFFLVH